MTSDSPHLRFAIVGIVTISLFASLFARLWFLQVVTAPEYQVAAENNRVRVVQEEAPRGRILDRQGRALVDNRRSIQVSIDWIAFHKLGGPSRTPTAGGSPSLTPEQSALLGRLAVAINQDRARQASGQAGTNPAESVGTGGSSTTTSTTTTTTTTVPAGEEGQVTVPPVAPRPPETAASLRKRLDDQNFSHFTPVPVATDVSETLEIYLVEHADRFPTVEAKRVTVRQYHYGTLLAHVLGYVGTVSPEDLKEFQNDTKPYELSDEVGKSGIEKSMEGSLRGTPGITRYEVDAQNRPVRVLAGGRRAVPGDDVYLSIDIALQYIVEKSLAAQLELVGGTCDRLGCYGKATSGASVVTDPRNGQVLAMASYPTYDPSLFTGGISYADYQALTSDANGKPLLNRAIGGTYAPGSTWKLFSTYSGLANKEMTPQDKIDDTGAYEVKDCKGGKCEFTNASRAVHGTVDLAQALTVSSDVYFYGLGDDMWRHRDFIGEDALAKTYAQWGFGTRTGVGLGGEQPGRIPSPKQKAELAAALYKGDQAEIDAHKSWYAGDNLNTVIGQGDVLVTPLQLVDGYAAFANGGTLYAPRFVSQVLKSFSTTVVDVPKAKVIRTIPLPPAWRLPILAGLEGVTQSSSPRGTAYTTFTGFPQSTFAVAGKTGTAQVGLKTKKRDTSLFVGFAPATDPHFAAVAILPEAGNGGDAAAPLVRRILEPLAEVNGDLAQLPDPPLGGRFDASAAANEVVAPASGGGD